MCMSMCALICMYTCMYLCAFVCVRVYVCMCMCVCVYVCKTNVCVCKGVSYENAFQRIFTLFAIMDPLEDYVYCIT